MLVAVSGSQGSGKSTILNGLKELGFTVIQRKTSRSILDEWGVPLDHINMDPALTIKFQEEIIKRKYDDDVSIHDADPSTIIFTERTFADLFSYTMAAMGSQNQHSEWINQYYQRCTLYQQCYDQVFYLTAGSFSVQNDGVRSTNHHFSRMMDLIMREYTEQMTGNGKMETISTPLIDERINIILIKTLTKAGWSVPDIMEFLDNKRKGTTR